jgi:hypothetical protein
LATLNTNLSIFTRFCFLAVHTHGFTCWLGRHSATWATALIFSAVDILEVRSHFSIVWPEPQSF